MNTDSPNGPGPERLICRVPCRPAQTDRGGALRWSTPACLICRCGRLPALPSPRRCAGCRQLAWPDLPTWIAGGRERRLTPPRDGCYEPGRRCATRASVRRRDVRACPPPDCAAYYRQLGGCPWPPGTTPWGRVRHAGPLLSVHPQAAQSSAYWGSLKRNTISPTVPLSRLTRWRTAVAGQPAHRPFGRAPPSHPCYCGFMASSCATRKHG